VSVGCPAGIGPEVAVSAAARFRGRCLLVGDEGVLRRAARVVGVSRLVVVDEPAEVRKGPAVHVWRGSTQLRREVAAGKPTREAGAAQLAWIDEALALVTGGACDALVTGPVSKAAIAKSGAPRSRGFRGHTEYLGSRLGAREVVMAFRSDRIATALATTHLPLRRVARAVTPASVAMACYWLARLTIDLGTKRPRLAVAALNPHAGEAGLLGDEEERAIEPGIRRARARLARERRAVDLLGPIGAETAFRRATAGEVDGVVAMYHDQATIACKLVGFGEAVNVTLGLGIVRTSVDHGTAYDLAGSGRADDRGMHEALELAARLASRR
jgi:4-hydroxythreonine-4-phosphate dehydrogenase